MGNCNCTSAKTVAKMVEDDNNPNKNSVFQYDKDARKIVYVGEDKVNSGLQAAATLSVSASGSAENSENGSINTKDSGLNENLSNVRSLLGEIAEYLDEDDSTYATGSVANASQYSGSIATTVTPITDKAYDNAVVSIRPHQAVSPLLFGTEDVQVPTPYTEKRVNNYEELIMMSKEQQMVKSAKKTLFGQRPQKELVYKNPSNSHEEDSLLAENHYDEESKADSISMKHPQLDEESKADSISMKHPQLDDESKADSISMKHPQLDEESMADSISMKQHPYYPNFDESTARDVSVFSKYANDDDDDKSNDTSLVGIDHVFSEDKSEDSSSGYNRRSEFLSALEEDHVPSDEEDDEVLIIEKSLVNSCDDENNVEDKKDANQEQNDTSVSFGSFMHVSYADEEEEDPGLANPVADFLNDATATTLNVDRDLIVFSPEFKEHVKKKVNETNEMEDYELNGVSEKENNSTDTIPMDEEESTSLSQENIPPSMPKMVVEMPDENNQAIIPEEVFSPIVNITNTIAAVEVGYDVPTEDPVSKSIIKNNALSGIIEDIIVHPHEKMEYLVGTEPNHQSPNEEREEIQPIPQTITTSHEEGRTDIDRLHDFDNEVEKNENVPVGVVEGVVEGVVSNILIRKDQSNEKDVINDAKHSVIDQVSNEIYHSEKEEQEVSSLENYGEKKEVEVNDAETELIRIEKLDIAKKETTESHVTIKEDQALAKPTDDYLDALSFDDNDDLIENVAEATVSGNIEYKTRDVQAAIKNESDDTRENFNDSKGKEQQAIDEEEKEEEVEKKVTMRKIEDKFEELQSFQIDIAKKSFSHLTSPAPSDEVEATRRSPSSSFSTASPMPKQSTTKVPLRKSPDSKTPPRIQSKNGMKKRPVRPAPLIDDFPDDVSEMSMRSVRSTTKVHTPTRKSYGGPTPTKSSLLRLAANNPNWKDDASFQSYKSNNSNRSSSLSVTPKSLPWDEKEIRKSRVISPRTNSSSTGSVYSNNSNWSSTDYISEGRKSAQKRVVAAARSRSADKSKKTECKRKWNPSKFAKKQGCLRCIALASRKEREQYFTQGRHPRIAMTSGGCHKSCPRTVELLKRYPELDAGEDELHAFCRICFNAMHR